LPTDFYIYEDEGYGVIIESFPDSDQLDKKQNKLNWHYEYSTDTEGEIYYFDSIITIPKTPKTGDTIKLQKIEFGHMEGTCGPQMDSVIFIHIKK